MRIFVTRWNQFIFVCQTNGMLTKTMEKKGIFSMGNMQIYCKSRFNNFVRADNGNKIPNTIKPCKNPNSAHFICKHQTNNFIYSKCIHTLFAMFRSNNSDISLSFFTEKLFCALLKPQFDILFELYKADRPCSWTPTYIIYCIKNMANSPKYAYTTVWIRSKKNFGHHIFFLFSYYDRKFI